jgi:paraquat-inducible protein B
MNEQSRRLKTGIFLVGSLLLVLAILFFLGGRDLFASKVKVSTYFEESVQGLSRGASVKYRGAPIGTVSDIRILFSKRIVRVDMEIDVDSFAGNNRDFKAEFIREVRENGLRCRLEYLGITGLKFVDFDYHKSVTANFETPDFLASSGTVYVPSVRSSFTDIYTSVAGAIEKINKINIEEIGDDVSRALREIVSLLADPALKSAISRIDEAAANLETGSKTLVRVLDEEQLARILASLDDNLKNLDSFIKTLNRDTAAAKLPESSAAFRAASEAVVESRMELDNTLLKLNQTIDSFRMLVEYLERDPGALLHGKNRSDEKR